MAASGTDFADLATPLFGTTRPNVPLVLFAGEATHPTQYSTIHGAYNRCVPGTNGAQGTIGTVLSWAI